MVDVPEEIVFPARARKHRGKLRIGDRPHIATIPSLAIFVIVLAANLLGDALRDVLDPRLQQ